MPNETIASPIEITPVDSVIGKENQSGHQARFSGSSSKELKELGDLQHARNLDSENLQSDRYLLDTLEKIEKEIGLRPVWNHEMTDEEALLELQHGKTGSAEYHEAQQRLVAKVVGKYGKGDGNFLRNGNVEVLGIPFFKRDLDKSWTHANGILRVDVTKELQDKPSKLRMLHALSDSAELYARAYSLTRQYIRNDLVEPDLLNEYNNLDPQLRREMLKLFQLPAGAKAPNDGVSGVQEKWMYPDQKPEDPKINGAKSPEDAKSITPQPPEVPEPIVITAEEIDPELAVVQKYLDRLTDEQRSFLLDENNFTHADLIASAQRLNSLVPGWEGSLINSRMRNGTVLFSPGNTEQAILLDFGVPLSQRDTFFDDEPRVNNELQNIENYLTNNGLSFEQYMALNMLAYSSEKTKYIEQDFNFKRQLFERYKQEQAKKEANDAVTPTPAPGDVDLDKQGSVDAIKRWGENNKNIKAVPITQEIRGQIRDFSDLESDAQAGNFPFFYITPDGSVKSLGGVYMAVLEVGRYEGPREMAKLLDPIEPLPQELVVFELDDLLYKLEQSGLVKDRYAINDSEFEIVRAVLLTKLDVPPSQAVGSVDYTGFENKTRLAIWNEFKTRNNIQG